MSKKPGHDYKIMSVRNVLLTFLLKIFPITNINREVANRIIRSELECQQPGGHCYLSCSPGSAAHSQWTPVLVTPSPSPVPRLAPPVVQSAPGVALNLLLTISQLAVERIAVMRQSQ